MPETAAKPRKKANRFRVRLSVLCMDGEFRDRFSVYMTKRLADKERTAWATAGFTGAEVVEDVSEADQKRPEGRMSAHARKAAGG